MLADGLSLLGFMDEKKAVDYLEKRYIVQAKTKRDLSSHWHKARGMLGKPFADAGRPTFLDIPAEHLPHLQRVASHPRFCEAIQGVRSWSFKLVEIDKL